jgi:hypothetical protein
VLCPDAYRQRAAIRIIPVLHERAIRIAPHKLAQSRVRRRAPPAHFALLHIYMLYVEVQGMANSRKER